MWFKDSDDPELFTASEKNKLYRFIIVLNPGASSYNFRVFDDARKLIQIFYHNFEGFFRNVLSFFF